MKQKIVQMSPKIVQMNKKIFNEQKFVQMSKKKQFKWAKNIVPISQIIAHMNTKHSLNEQKKISNAQKQSSNEPINSWP